MGVELSLVQTSTIVGKFMGVLEMLGYDLRVLSS